MIFLKLPENRNNIAKIGKLLFQFSFGNEINKFNDWLDNPPTLLAENSPIDESELRQLILRDLPWLKALHQRYIPIIKEHLPMLSVFSSLVRFARIRHTLAYYNNLLEALEINKKAVALLEEKTKKILVASLMLQQTEKLSPENILLYEHWIKDTFPEESKAIFKKSPTPSLPHVTPIQPPEVSLKQLKDYQTWLKQTYQSYPLNYPPKIPFNSIYESIKQSFQTRIFSWKILAALLLFSILLTAGAPFWFAFSLLSAFVFQTTIHALWQGLNITSQYLSWFWKEAQHLFDFPLFIQTTSLLPNLENNLFFIKRILANGPVDLTSCDVKTLSNEIKERLKYLKNQRSLIIQPWQESKKKDEKEIYEYLSAQIDQQIESFETLSQKFLQTILTEINVVFKTPNALPFTPSLSSGQLVNLQAFVDCFGNKNERDKFFEYTNAINYFTNALIHPEKPTLTIPLLTPKDSLIRKATYPFGTHTLNETALTLYEAFVRAYEIDINKVEAVQIIIGVLNGTQDMTPDTLLSYVKQLKIDTLMQDTLMDAIGHHLFLTQDEPTTNQAALFPKKNITILEQWYKENHEKMHAASKHISHFIKSAEAPSSIELEDNLNLMHGQYVRFQSRRKKTENIRSKLKAYILKKAKSISGEMRGILYYVYPLWRNNPPLLLLSTLWSRRFDWLLHNPSSQNTQQLIEDTRACPTPKLSLFSTWLAIFTGYSDIPYYDETEDCLEKLKEASLITSDEKAKYSRKGAIQALNGL